MRQRKSKKKPPPKQRTLSAAYKKALSKVVDQIYVEADKYFDTWGALAIYAGLARGTVYRLGNFKTKLPQFRTIWKLARAVGWDITFEVKPKIKKAAA